MEGMKKIKGESPMEVPSAAQKFYPHIHFTFKDLPQAKNWKVGESYNVSLEIKQVSMHAHEDGGSADFEIRGIKVNGEKKSPRYKV